MKVDLSKISVDEFLLLSEYVGGFSASAFEQIEPNGYGFDFWQLNLYDFGELSQSRTPERITNYFYSQSASEYVAKQKAFEAFMIDFSTSLNKFTMKPTADEETASAACPPYMANEGLLVFVRQFFGLKNFTEAEKITLADVYLAKKSSYIAALYERRLNEAKDRKFKAKRK